MPDAVDTFRHELEPVIATALQAGLADPARRDLLLAWLPAGLVGSLPRSAAPIDQLRSDIFLLLKHEVERRQPALSVWLENAERLTDFLPGVPATFATFRRRLATHLSQLPAAAIGPAPGGSPPPPAEPTSIRIQFLSAQPRNVQGLGLEDELARIRRKLESGLRRDRLKLGTIETAVQIREIQDRVRRSDAGILHFSGHGNGAGDLLLKGEDGMQQELPVSAFVRLVEMANDVRPDKIVLVVLNACHSEHIAWELVAGPLKHAIGTNVAVDDEAAIAFAEGFYSALADGVNLKAAFDAGCWQVSILTPLLRKYEKAFELACAPGVDPRGVFITPR